MGQYDDDFFSRATCERCGKSIAGHARTMSWFTEETICTSGRHSCQFLEERIKSKLRKRGKDPRNYEGCGYIPVVDNSVDLIKED